MLKMLFKIFKRGVEKDAHLEIFQKQKALLGKNVLGVRCKENVM